MRLSRRPVLGLFAATALGLALSACGGGEYAASEGDMAIGAADAPVTVVEYFSVTCGACAHFHATVFPTIKERYIDTGRVRWVFRELLTPPQSVSLAGFQVARCGGADGETYANRTGVMLERQREILTAGSADGVRARLLQIGQQAGLSAEAIEACINDPTGAERARAMAEMAQADGATGTPTLILNGEALRDNQQYTVEGLSALFDAQAGPAG
jgi:protein-disulfide isomerase